MDNEEIYETLSYHVNDCDPSSFRFLTKESLDHPSFVSVVSPYSTVFDYIKSVNDYIIVIFPDNEFYSYDVVDEIEYCYSIFNDICDYLYCALNDSDTIMSFGTGFDSFDDCYKTALCDVIKYSLTI